LTGHISNRKTVPKIPFFATVPEITFFALLAIFMALVF